MTEPSKPSPSSRDEKRDVVHCRRLDRTLPVSEHAECPYCFGGAVEIESAEHERFCDFDPERDPSHFGFRRDSDRFAHG